MSKRITVTVSDEVADVLARLSRLQGRSMASQVREWLEVVLPGLERAARFGEAAEKATQREWVQLLEAIEEVERDIAAPSDKIMHRVFDGFDQLAPVVPLGPPSSNRGVNGGKTGPIQPDSAR